MARKFGRSVDEFKSIHAPEADVAFLRARVAEMEAKLASQKLATGEAMVIMEELREAIAVSTPTEQVYRRRRKASSPCTHVMHVTDWHYGATTDADEVDGFGEFSPEIAEARVATLSDNILNNTEAMRHGYNVPKLHVIGTGDYISGSIHHELDVTNAFPPAVQAIRCGYLLGGMLAKMAPHFEEVVADLVTLDNHGRLTQKPQAAQGGLNNYGYIVAEVARQHVSAIPNVTVRVHAKPTALVVVGPESYLAFHGHQIKGWAGKPYYGFDRRVAMEAVKRMGVPESAFTKLLLGHFHHAIDGDTWMLGGSLSGTDAFDHSCGRHSKPHQTSWYVHPEHGEFAFTRWWL